MNEIDDDNKWRKKQEREMNRKEGKKDKELGKRNKK